MLYGFNFRVMLLCFFLFFLMNPGFISAYGLLRLSSITSLWRVYKYQYIYMFKLT